MERAEQLGLGALDNSAVLRHPSAALTGRIQIATAHIYSKAALISLRAIPPTISARHLL